jgi:hypothetical protein
MHRIDNPSASASLPIPKPAGPDGYFTSGNPNTGQPATIVEYDFLNTIQEELATIVLKGGETFDKTDNGQVLKALGSMLTGAFSYIYITQNILVPPWATRIEFELVGAGGGGAHAQSDGTNYTAGAGGGAGGYGAAQRNVAPGSLLNAVIGVGGASDANGTTTSLASSGNWTVSAGGGDAGGWDAVNNSPGGPGGTVSGADLNVQGAWGGDGQAYGVTATTGYGANSIYGGATRSFDYTTLPAATGPGSGGGGCYDHTNSNTFRPGGAGAGGMLKYRFLP